MMADKSIDTQLEFLLKMEKEYPAGLMIYGPTIADYYYRSGDYAKSVEYADKMIAKNLYWYTGKYDAAIKICEEGIEASGGDSDIYRNEAIAYMLKGDYAKANECGKNAYQFSMNYGDLTLDIINTAALAAGLAKDDDTYKTLQDYLKTYNYEISTVVTDCLAGKKTVEQVFITDGGVIS